MAPGRTTVTITARDPAGLQALLSVAVTVTGAPSSAPGTGRSTARESSADNAPPQAAQPIPRQTVPAGETSAPLDLTPYFTDPRRRPPRLRGGVDNVSVAIADLPRGSSRLTLHGVAAGQAIVTVTASDPQGAPASSSA